MMRRAKLQGFDVEIAHLIARGVDRTPPFIFVAFASNDQSIERGDADIGLSGIEDTPARWAGLATRFVLRLARRDCRRPRRGWRSVLPREMGKRPRQAGRR